MMQKEGQLSVAVLTGIRSQHINELLGLKYPEFSQPSGLSSVLHDYGLFRVF